MSINIVLYQPDIPQNTGSKEKSDQGCQWTAKMSVKRGNSGTAKMS